MTCIDTKEVEIFLENTAKSLVANSSVTSIGSKLVELVNSGMSVSCPSAEGYKFVVHATVQEEWGQGSLVGAKCEWDNKNDKVISITHNTDRINICIVVFFVHIEDEVDSDDGDR